MTALVWVGLSVAFLGPPPPRRGWQDPPGPPRRANGWVLGLIAWFLLVVTLTPLSLALSERGTLSAFSAECRSAGGRVTHARAEDGRPYRCDHARH
ncbi:hypothetical protein [Methylobacterium planeticum]|uniref:Uncharacterized protein n=1 Tax=Methylobacterium planeticum TaxID=2615211 RepID=A0A6N6MSB2_9HYPH|nr:hypothetical protein [Methylobacterium planeticum]KAB1072451.1 hypothetical protein F6X51_15785 [Methylobacterium planeticum]